MTGSYKIQASNVPNLGVTVKDIKYLFKKWDADFLGVSTKDMDLDLYLTNKLPEEETLYEEMEAHCNLSQTIDVSEWASVSVEMHCDYVKPGYKLPKGANKFTFYVTRDITSLPYDEEDEWEGTDASTITPTLKREVHKVALNANSKWVRLMKQYENDVGYFSVVKFNDSVYQEDDNLWCVTW